MSFNGRVYKEYKATFPEILGVAVQRSNMNMRQNLSRPFVKWFDASKTNFSLSQWRLIKLSLIFFSAVFSGIVQAGDLFTGTPLAGTKGIRAIQGPIYHPRLGESFDVISDINGDGRRDFVVQERDILGGDRYLLRAVSGGTGEKIYELNYPSTEPLSQITTLDDINDDGYLDYLVARTSPAVNCSTGAGSQYGTVTLYSGLDGSVLWNVYGRYKNAYFGVEIWVVGDIDADGESDFSVQEPGLCNGNVGRTYVLSGEDGHQLYEFSGNSSGNTSIARSSRVFRVDDITSDGRPDLAVQTFTNTGTPELKFYSGNGGSYLSTISNANGPVDSVGDQDGDTIGDFFMKSGASNRHVIISGANFSTLTTLPLGPSSTLGVVFRAGDWNGDGKEDVAISHYELSNQTAQDLPVNIVSAYNGNIIKSQSIRGVQYEPFAFGSHLVATEDLNGDGTRDLLIGDWSYTSNGLYQNGAVFSPFGWGSQDYFQVGNSTVIF